MNILKDKKKGNHYLTSVYTDAGIKKKTNQDAVLVKAADTDYGRVLLAVVCDGMGGLAKGEVASAALIRAFSDWFEERFPVLFVQNFQEEALRRDWDQLISDMNSKISDYGIGHGLRLGTTLAGLLLVGSRYYIINIGDSRIYQITDRLIQLTRDHTYVQREMDLGHMTCEEAMRDSRRNVLIQCVGAGSAIAPDYYTGVFEKNTVFLLCSDGFRHLVTPEELYQCLNPRVLQTEKQMAEQAVYLTELNKSRNETDNISVALIKVCQGREGYAADRLRSRRKI